MSTLKRRRYSSQRGPRHRFNRSLDPTGSQTYCSIPLATLNRKRHPHYHQDNDPEKSEFTTKLVQHQLTNDELAALGRRYRVQLTIPYSQLEAEAVHRNVDLTTILRVHLILLLRKVGAL